MPVENLDVIRRGHAAFNRGDLGPAKDGFSVDIEWGAVGAFPGLADVYRGHDGIDEWMETVRSSFAEFHVSLEQVIRDEKDFAVIAEHLRAIGRESRAEVEMRIYSVYWFRDGKVAKRRAYTTKAEALEAAPT